MTPSKPDDPGRGDAVRSGDDPQLRYIAQMPAARQRPPQAPGDVDQDSTAAFAASQHSNRPTGPVPAGPGPYQAAGGWGGPPPAQPAERRSQTPKGGWLAPLAVILVSIVALATVFLVTQGGGDDRRAAPPSPSATTTGSGTSQNPSSSTPSSTSDDPTSSSSASSSSSSSTSSATLPAGVKVCGPGVGAGATTTCGFATNVASAVRSAGKDSGTFSVHAWSPTTKKDYTLSCRAAPVTVCTGGRAAVIHVTR